MRNVIYKVGKDNKKQYVRMRKTLTYVQFLWTEDKTKAKIFDEENLTPEISKQLDRFLMDCYLFHGDYFNEQVE